MARDKDPKDPSTTSDAYDVMIPRWKKIDALLGGTETMRNAQLELLPRHEEETERAYQERISKAVLFNVTELTLDSMVGRPFSDPVVRTDVPETVDRWLDDVDLLGNDVHTFSRAWFRDGLAKAFSHVLIDMPKLEEGERPRTLADDREQGTRPYWIQIPPEQVISMRATVVNGQEVLTHVRIFEPHTEAKGFSEVVVERIRELNLVQAFLDEAGDEVAPFVAVRIWERVPDDKKRADQSEWFVIDEFTMEIPFIPMVTFYATKREDLGLAKPPLTDLADLNVSHWQGDSEQATVLTVARFPMLAASGVVDEKGDTVVVGPKVSLVAGDPNAKFYYVEHSGAAIESGRQDQKDKEERMAEYGAQFLKKRPGDQTATARALDSAEATSPLQDMSIRFSDALNQALMLTAVWAKIDPGAVGTLEINTEFGPENVEQSDLATLLKARENKEISREAFIIELIRRGVLVDDYDPDADLVKLEAEAMDALKREPMIDIDPAATDDDEEEEEIDEEAAE